MNPLELDAEALYRQLLGGVRALLTPGAVLVGIYSGGAWLAERLQRDLKLPGEHGVVSSALHRDDYEFRGLSGGADHTRLPFDVRDRQIVLIDDVLYTGRTIRAALNELFDFGRPARVDLAVLVDRGGRELPIQPAFAAAQVPPDAIARDHKLALTRDEAGQFRLTLEEA